MTRRSFGLALLALFGLVKRPDPRGLRVVINGYDVTARVVEVRFRLDGRDEVRLVGNFGPLIEQQLCCLSGPSRTTQAFGNGSTAG